jgi:hypothetical protein
LTAACATPQTSATTAASPTPPPIASTAPPAQDAESKVPRVSVEELKQYVPVFQLRADAAEQLRRGDDRSGKRGGD